MFLWTSLTVSQSEQIEESGLACAPCPVEAGDLLAEQIQGKNINEISYLATDYLNHFGEIIMLIEMAVMMPECREDALAWEPKSYCDHFLGSGLSAPDVYIAAYEAAPMEYRFPFDETVEKMTSLAHEGIQKLGLAEEVDERASVQITEIVAQLRTLSDQAASIVNGHLSSSRQDAIDAIMDDQDAIDAIMGG